MTQPDADFRPHPDLVGLTIPEGFEGTIDSEVTHTLKDNALAATRSAVEAARASTTARDEAEYDVFLGITPPKPQETVLLES